MAKLMGSISLNKRLLAHPVWQREPFSVGQAWVDLLLRANDAARTIRIHGEDIPLRRGQLAWSIRALEIEWKRSGEWTSRTLKDFQEQAMIVLETTRRGTIITILNYDAYNSVRQDTDSGSEPDSVSDTDSGSEPERKGEQGRGIGNRESGIPPVTEDFAEVPSRAEVLAFALAFAGDSARGIPAVIPEAWAESWFTWRLDGHFPKKWRADFLKRFARDWLAKHPKALAGSGGSGRGSGSKKNAAVQTPGRSPAQARFELSRELEEVKARLDAAHDTGVQPGAKDKAREKVLRQMIKELPE